MCMCMCQMPIYQYRYRYCVRLYKLCYIAYILRYVYFLGHA